MCVVQPLASVWSRQRDSHQRLVQCPFVPSVAGGVRNFDGLTYNAECAQIQCVPSASYLAGRTEETEALSRRGLGCTIDLLGKLDLHALGGEPLSWIDSGLSEARRCSIDKEKDSPTVTKPHRNSCNEESVRNPESRGAKIVETPRRETGVDVERKNQGSVRFTCTPPLLQSHARVSGMIIPSKD